MLILCIQFRFLCIFMTSYDEALHCPSHKRNKFSQELADEVFERTENVYSGSIISETLTILV